MIQGALDTLNREVIELVRLVEIWGKDPQDYVDKKMFRYYEELLSQHRLAISRLTRI
jgi:hypothetical protein